MLILHYFPPFSYHMNCTGALYGPEPIRQTLWGAIWGALSTIPGSKHYFEKDVGADSILHSRAKTLGGVPNLLELDWISWRTNGAHNFFSPISAVTGKAAMAQVELVERKAREHGFDFMNTLIVGLREVNTVFYVFFLLIRQMTERAKKLMLTFLTICKNKKTSASQYQLSRL